jgi:polyribonucleotide nucleotidyltransferase
VLSHDLENDPDIVGMIGASAALVLSGVPVHGPDRRLRASATRMAPMSSTPPRRMTSEETELDLVVAGTKDAVMMVESEAYELPKTTCWAP